MDHRKKESMIMIFTKNAPLSDTPKRLQPIPGRSFLWSIFTKSKPTPRVLILLCLLFLFLFPTCDYQPYKQGKGLYDFYCANCHMDAGEGLRGLYPPLAKSDYLAQHQDQLACIIRYGLSGKIVVNGREYDLPMAPISNLNDVEITNIINYINHSWGNDLPVRKIKEIQQELEQCEEK